MSENQSTLVFEPLTHTYMIDGRIVPCVSDVLAVYGQDVDESSEQAQAIERAAERGTICHAILEQAVHGFFDDEYPEAYEGYVQAIRLFLAEHHIQPIAAELPLYSERLGVAGTPDLLAMFDGQTAILDYKFVAQIAKTKVKAQLNGYRAIYEDNGVFVDALYAVQFLPDGTYRLYPVELDDTELQAAIAVYRLKQKKHPRGRIA